MDYSWVRQQDVLDRLDPIPYRNEYIKLISILNSHKTSKLKDICDEIKCGPFGSTVLSDSYCESGILYLRPVNISANKFDETQITFLSSEDVKNKNLDVFNSKDIFFARVGTPSVSKVSSKYSEITISPNIVAVRTGEHINSNYLWMFLSSKYGMFQLERMLKTVAQPTTSTETIKNLDIFIPDAKYQIYIDEKINKAVNMYEEAEKLKLSIVRLLNNSINLNDLFNYADSDKSTYKWIDSKKINDRMDSEFYKSEFSIVDNYFENNNHKKLKEYFKDIKKGTEIGSENYCNEEVPIKFIRVSDISDEFVDIKNAIGIKKEFNLIDKCTIKEDDLIISKDGTIGICTIGNKYNKGNVLSGALVRGECREKDYVHYLFWVFKQNLIQLQISRKCYGSIIKHLKLEDLKNIVIPVLGKDVETKIISRSKEYMEKRINSKKIIEECVIDIEDMIEGTFDISKLTNDF